MYCCIFVLKQVNYVSFRTSFRALVFKKTCVAPPQPRRPPPRVLVAESLPLSFKIVPTPFTSKQKPKKNAKTPSRTKKTTTRESHDTPFQKMSSKNFLIRTLDGNYRRFQQRRPSVMLQKVDPDRRWCVHCALSVRHKEWPQHCAGKQHILNFRKHNKLRNFALQLWENHRGAAVDEESDIEQKIRHGTVADAVARQRERSEAMAGRIRDAERHVAATRRRSGGGDGDNDGYEDDEEETFQQPQKGKLLTSSNPRLPPAPRDLNRRPSKDAEDEDADVERYHSQRRGRLGLDDADDAQSAPGYPSSANERDADRRMGAAVAVGGVGGIDFSAFKESQLVRDKRLDGGSGGVVGVGGVGDRGGGHLAALKSSSIIRGDEDGTQYTVKTSASLSNDDGLINHAAIRRNLMLQGLVEESEGSGNRGRSRADGGRDADRSSQFSRESQSQSNKGEEIRRSGSRRPSEFSIDSPSHRRYRGATPSAASRRDDNHRDRR